MRDPDASAIKAAASKLIFSVLVCTNFFSVIIPPVIDRFDLMSFLLFSGALASDVYYDPDEPSFEAFLPKVEPECTEQFDDADEEPSFIAVPYPPNDEGSRDSDEAYGHTTDADDSSQTCSWGYQMDTVSQSDPQSPARSQIKEVRFDLGQNHTTSNTTSHYTTTEPEESCRKSCPNNHVTGTSIQFPEAPLKSILKVSDLERESMMSFVHEDSLDSSLSTGGDYSECECPCSSFNEKLATFHLPQNHTTADPADSSQEDQELLTSDSKVLLRRKFPPGYYYTADTASQSSIKPLAAASIMPESTVGVADSSHKCSPGNYSADTSSKSFNMTLTADSSMPESTVGVANFSRKYTTGNNTADTASQSSDRQFTADSTIPNSTVGIADFSQEYSSANCVTELWSDQRSERTFLKIREDVPETCQEPEFVDSSSDVQIDSVSTKSDRFCQNLVFPRMRNFVTRGCTV